MSVVSEFLQGVQIAGQPASKEQLTSAHNALKGALKNDDSLRYQIRKDLADLGYNAGQVEQNFGIVQGVVNELDGREMLQNNEKFGSRWEVLHRRYSVNLSQSKASITELHNQIHEFVNVLLPMVESEDPETIKQVIKSRRLEEYVQIITAFHEPAENRGNEFLYLKQEVAAFHNNLDTALPNSDNQMHNERNRLNSEIDNMLREIEDLRRQVAWLASLCRYFTVEAHQFKSMNSKAEQIERNRQQIPRLEQNEECMHRIMNLLKEHTSWFDETTQKLSGMEGIWRMLTNDATKLQTRLSAMEKEEDSDAFNLRADSVRPVYETLESALEAYISAL
ncbi:hypothetical protein GALMADRAFT_1353281 [Galerina marginata CBS 339.88]|uniref:Uncharacterized protein n=1 Tax=Galerina marginata (strain CBS 339.88) TaxID=685588 RepID=A0A067SD96_GALM3|nr:hypothetical protein GALMADRAFT_1353281 [Galerina marginata CBS 339.88]